MKIAVLLTGTTRNYKLNYSNWKKNIFDKYDCDIFFHTYDIIGYQKSKDTLVEPILDDKLEEKDLINLLKPVDYIIEIFNERINLLREQIKSQFIGLCSAKPEYIMAQLHSIHAANELKKQYEEKNNIKYDLVIKMRFDSEINSELKYSDVEKLVNNNNIILSGNNSIKAMAIKTGCENCIKLNQNIDSNHIKCKNHTVISDIVMISSTETMNLITSLYNVYQNMCYDNLNNRKCFKIPYEKYPNGMLYVSGSQVHMYPEFAYALFLKDYIILNYDMQTDTNRIVH
jgi:hypothetical protein